MPSGHGARPLTPKQQLFVEAYCADANGSAIKAYEQAGYGNKQHGQKRAYHILHNPRVQRAISERLDAKKAVFRVREDEILEGLYKEAKNEKARPSERIQAWVHLGKHLGMFREKDKDKDTHITYNILNYNNKSKEIEEKTREALEAIPEVIE